MTNRIASCSCGRVQAKVKADPIRVSVCHCLACQQRTGSVFAAQARFASSAVTITGITREFVRVGDGGSKATFRFCPQCACTVYYTSDAREGEVMIPIGAFADPRFPAPTFSVYEERMHSWVVMPPGIEHMG
jgi:hypothetical protein